jgi:hypothetical protein
MGDIHEHLSLVLRYCFAEAGQKVQAYADTDSPQEAEEKKMGMREKMRQMGVSP